MKQILQVVLVGLTVIFAGAAMAGPWGRGMGQGYGVGSCPYATANLTGDQTAQMQTLRESFLKDLVITDYAMPAMDGDEFIMQLRKTNPHRDQVRELHEKIQEIWLRYKMECRAILTPKQLERINSVEGGRRPQPGMGRMGWSGQQYIY